jgi:hypothetical protein
MKKIIFISLFLYAFFRINAQTQEVGVLNLTKIQDFYKVSPGHSLHNKIRFSYDLDPLGIVCSPGYGNSDFTLVQGLNPEFTLPISSQDATYKIYFKSTSGELAGLIDITIKGTTSVDNAGFQLPDEIWEVSSSATFEPPVAGAFPEGSPYNSSTLGGGHAYLKFAPEHYGKLKKPLIFVDGIDFNSTTYTYDGQVIRHGSTGWDVLTLGNDASETNPLVPEPSEFKDYPAAIKTFLMEGYDVIFMDFASGADYIQKNGLVLTKLIEMVNQRRAQDDPENAEQCENVVVGASMGGQVAKWALTYMESNGILHKTHTYVSFDSPQRGAHIPLSIQAAAYMNAHTGNPGQWDRLNTPAARQMIIESLETALSSGRCELEIISRTVNGINETLTEVEENSNLVYANSQQIRTSFQNTMQNNGYPKRTRNVAISCGTSTGAELSFNDTDKFFQADLFLDLSGPQNLACGKDGYAFYLSMLGLPGGTDGIHDLLTFELAPGSGCGAFPVENQGNTLFLGAIPTDFDDWIGSQDPPTQHKIFRLTSNYPYPSLDNAPGCKRGDLYDIQRDLLNRGIQTSINTGYTTFMPTLSLLDINWPMDDNFLTNEVDIDGAGSIVEMGLTPFKAVYAPEINLQHIEITPEMVNFVLSQAAIGRDEINTSNLNLTTGQLYNYGNQKILVPDVIINEKARLSVNVSGTINYMTPNDPPANKPDFDVYTGIGCSDANTITIKNGGTLQIGDPENPKTGTLHALRNAVIHIEPGGTLRVSKSSSLIIYPGARLVMDAGASIILDNTESVLDIRGTWEYNGDFTFSGLGYIDYAAEQIEFGPGVNRFRMIGQLAFHRCLRTTVPLSLPPGIDLLLSRGALECSPQGIFVKGGAADCQSFGFRNASSSEYGLGTALYISGEGEVNLQSCVFSDNERPLVVQGAAVSPVGGGSNGNVTAFGCTFTNYSHGVWVSDRNEVRFNQCSLNPGSYSSGDERYGLFSEHNLTLLLRACNIKGFKSGTTNTYFTAVDAMSDASLSEGVRVRGGLYCWMDGGTIDDCDLGIGSRSAALVSAGDHWPANIMVTNEATISNCIVGVCGEGDASNGVVIASCAKFIDNRFAIGGKDMTLLIDPSQLNPTPQYLPYPNYFVLPTSPSSWFGALPDEKFISMCYAAKNPGGSILAESNFFGQHSASGSVTWLPLSQSLLDKSFDVRRSTTDATCSNNFVVIPVSASASPDIPRDCSDAVESCPPGSERDCARDCALQVSGGLTTATVRSEFIAGLSDLYNEQIIPGTDKLGYVSDLWQPELPETMTKECRTFIQAARSFVQGAEGRSIANPLKSSQGAEILYLMPNPANEQVVVTADGDVAKVWVTNLLGTVIVQALMVDNRLTLSTNEWPSGVYLVHARSGGKPLVKRLVVQH